MVFMLLGGAMAPQPGLTVPSQSDSGDRPGAATVARWLEADRVLFREFESLTSALVDGGDLGLGDLPTVGPGRGQVRVRPLGFGAVAHELQLFGGYSTIIYEAMVQIAPTDDGRVPVVMLRVREVGSSPIWSERRAGMAGKATDAPALSGLLFQWRNGGRWLQHQQRIEAELGRAAGGTIPAACQKLVAHLCDPLADATIPTALGLRRSPLATGEHGSVMRMMLRSPSPAARAYAAGLLVGSAEATAEDKAAIKALKRDQAIVMVGIHDLRAEVTIEKYLSDIEAW